MAGSIHKYQTKKGDTRYFVMLEIGQGGKRKQQKKMGFKTKKEANAFLAEQQTVINKGDFVEPSKRTFGDFLIQWLEYREKLKKINKNKSKQTEKVYRDYINFYIIPFFGDKALSSLTTSDVNNFIAHMCEVDRNELELEKAKKNNRHIKTPTEEKIGYSPRTIKKAVEIIKVSLEHALSEGLISKNVAKKAKLPQLESKNEMKIWTKEESKRFIETAKEDEKLKDYAIIFSMCLETGIRQSELLGLRWKDIDFEKRTLTIRQVLSHDAKEIYEGAKSIAGNRTIHLTKQLIDDLRSHKKVIEENKKKHEEIYVDHDLVICTAIGTPLNPSNLRNRIFKPLMEKANVPKIRFHDLRHTNASLLFAQGLPAKQISDRLGHASVKITWDIYTHILPSVQEETVKALEEIFGS